MAAPAFQAAGTIVRSTGALTVAWPTPHQADDIGVLIVETANQAPTLSTPAGFTQFAQQGTGTAGTSGATMQTWFWCRATGSSQASPVVADSGDHQVAVIITIRGCITSGNPYDVVGGGVQASAQTGYSIPSITTTVANTLVMLGLSNNGDASTNQIGATPTNANLSNIVERADSQPIPTSEVTAMLRIGPYGGLMDLVGIGPGGDTGAPYYRLAGINPFDNLTNLGAVIDTADTLDIVLSVLVANTNTQYGSNTAGGFVLGCSDPTNLATFDAAGTKSFCGQLQRLKASADWAKLVDAFARGRAIALALDEPYHAKWDNSSGVNTWPPTKVNQACRAIKTIVGGPVQVICRADADKMRNGWDGFAGLANYDAVDYCVMQYEGPQASAQLSFDGALAAARTDATACGIKVVPALNIWGGGVKTGVTDTIDKCWQYDPNDLTSNGVIAGSVQNANSPYSPGQRVPCATWAAAPGSTAVASPAWIRRCIDKVYNDASIPWMYFWTYSRPSLGNIDSWAGPLQVRPDMVAALDYMVNKGLSRPSATAIPAPKA